MRKTEKSWKKLRKPEKEQIEKILGYLRNIEKDLNNWERERR